MARNKCFHKVFLLCLAILAVISVAINICRSMYKERPESLVGTPLLGDAITSNMHLFPDDSTRLTYFGFKNLLKKQQWVKEKQEAVNNGYWGSGFYNPIMDLVKYKSCEACPDSTDEFYGPRVDDKPQLHYIGLPGYRLRTKDARHFMQGDQSWLVYYRADDSTGRTDSLRAGSQWTFRKIPFRFAYNESDTDEKKTGKVLIPIGTAVFTWLYPVLLTLLTAIFLLLLYMGFVYPIKVLMRISRGEIFTDQNTRQLYRAACAWLIPPFAILLVHFILYLAFQSTLGNEVRFMPLDTLQSKQWWLIGGLILLAVAKAFKRGLALQNEQALTI